jgi:hypothetical protein
LAKLKMSLLDNAYDSVNESLRLAERAETSERAWKFAILNLVQAIELLLKERLYRENSLFIYDNIDRPHNTVSLQLALQRIQRVGIAIDAKDIETIEKAREWRNLILHYEFELFINDIKSVYALLFEFAHSFHHNHLGGELHQHIEDELWHKEASLMEYFRQKFVTYQGFDMVSYWPRQIVEAQDLQTISIERVEYPRIRYGQEKGYDEISDYANAPCHDCGIHRGQYHVPMCDMEQCPKCLRQLISCECDTERDEDKEAPPSDDP